MQGERNELERRSVHRQRENSRWGTKGYKYPQIQNSNDYIPEFGTSDL
jgi:predicted membrane-bound dolichyl-phosphate-mannose-protein mannosyltransferase